MRSEISVPTLPRSCVALGYFDGLHLGHRSVIGQAFGDGGTNVVLSVGKAYRTVPYIGGTVTDTAILLENERARILDEMGADILVSPRFEDICRMSGEEFVEEILCRKLNAQKVACGYNYRFGRDAKCDAATLKMLCEQRKIECVTVPEVRCDDVAVSSSVVRRALLRGDIDLVNRLLGRRYGYQIEVSHGRQLGRELGAPTINQVFPEGLLLPRFGVYASITYTGENDAPQYAVTNIGVKPTVGSEVPLSETWIPEFSGDLYECSVRVELLHFIRAEQRFDSLEVLKNAIQRDAACAREAAKQYGMCNR